MAVSEGAALRNDHWSAVLVSCKHVFVAFPLFLCVPLCLWDTHTHPDQITGTTPKLTQ